MKFSFISVFLLVPVLVFGQGVEGGQGQSRAEQLLDSLDGGREELLAKIENMPNIEVGKGVTFRPKNDSYELTLRFRMQNMLGLSFNEKFSLTETQAQIKRLRLRFDGYIFSPQIVYSIQLGFTSYDADPLPNGNMNIVRDAIVYYVPNSTWNIGFGQTKIKASRARVNSSSALQFVDRSIVNSEFTVDRDFGLFGEYNLGTINSPFALSAKASITLGEGRNWQASSASGFDYTGRLELYPFGRFHANGELLEGDNYFEERPKMMIGGAYSYNHNAMRDQGQKGSVLPDGETRNIGSYFADLVFKYRGFGFIADYMGRLTHDSASSAQPGYYIYTGAGLNVQASYIYDRKWEVALRSSTMMPDQATIPFAGYRVWTQSTLGLTRYIIGHSLKIQLDMSYNHMIGPVNPDYDRWGVRFQVELGL